MTEPKFTPGQWRIEGGSNCNCTIAEDCEVCEDKSPRLKCDGCNLARINGLICHETGCDYSWIDPETGESYPVECFECGGEFIPESRPPTCNPNARGVHNYCESCANPEPCED